MKGSRRKVLRGRRGASAAGSSGPSRCRALRASRKPDTVKIGMSMPQTGSLGAGGQAALLALRMWVDDVNQKRRPARPQGRADRLRRPDQPGQRPGHLHQAARRRQGRPADRALRHGADGADHADGEAARPAADGQLLVPGEREGAARHVVQQLAVERRRRAGPTASSRPGRSSAPRPSPSWPPTRSSRRTWRTARASWPRRRGIKSVYDQNYPPTTTDFSSLIRGIRAAKPDMVFVMSYPNDSVAIVRAVNEIGVGSAGARCSAAAWSGCSSRRS